jgi:uncharacterized damage-inducible protein DinB
MMNTQTARMLAQYKARADKLMFESVAALPPGEAEKERRTLFKSIIGTLNRHGRRDRRREEAHGDGS